MDAGLGGGFALPSLHLLGAVPESTRSTSGRRSSPMWLAHEAAFEEWGGIDCAADLAMALTCPSADEGPRPRRAVGAVSQVLAALSRPDLFCDPQQQRTPPKYFAPQLAETQGQNPRLAWRPCIGVWPDSGKATARPIRNQVGDVRKAR